MNKPTRVHMATFIRNRKGSIAIGIPFIIRKYLIYYYRIIFYFFRTYGLQGALVL